MRYAKDLENLWEAINRNAGQALESARLHRSSSDLHGKIVDRILAIETRLTALEADSIRTRNPDDDDPVDMSHYLGEHPPLPDLPTDGKAETTK